jgi:hypothetical protein
MHVQIASRNHETRLGDSVRLDLREMAGIRDFDGGARQCRLCYYLC